MGRISSTSNRGCSNGAARWQSWWGAVGLGSRRFTRRDTLRDTDGAQLKVSLSSHYRECPPALGLGHARTNPSATQCAPECESRLSSLQDTRTHIHSHLPTSKKCDPDSAPLHQVFGGTSRRDAAREVASTALAVRRSSSHLPFPSC